MIGWTDLINGQRLASVVSAAVVAQAFFPQARRFWWNFVFRIDNSFVDRLTFGLCLIAMGSFFYGSSAILESFIGRNNLVSAIPLVAGAMTLLGYYQVYIARRAASLGKLNGFVWRYAGLIGFVFIAGTLLNAWLGNHMAFRGP